jgi:hypothetical protein
MQVLALGLPRCGTSSLQAALESDVFGLTPCLHQGRVGGNPAKQDAVIAALNEPSAQLRHKILHTLFDGYAATTDAPGAFFPDDLMDMYPDAAVVLNQRQSAQAWEKSYTEALGFFLTWHFQLATALSPMTRLLRTMRDVKARSERQFGIRLPVHWNAEYYEKYNAFVLDEARKRGRRVLVWQAADGWAPLCEFLGRSEPEDGRPFPHKNDAAQVRMMRRHLYARGLRQWAVLGGSIMALWAAWTYRPLLFASARAVGSRFLGSRD